LIWIVSVKADVLEDCKVQRIEFWILIEANLEECASRRLSDCYDEGVTIYDSSGVYVENVYFKWEYEDYVEPFGWNGHGCWFWYGIESDSSFHTGEYFYFDFDVQYPYRDHTLEHHVSHDLCWISHSVNQNYQQTLVIPDGEPLKIYFDVGPTFVVPELPLGTLATLVISLITLRFYTRAPTY
jgi:hypothetical protein